MQRAAVLFSRARITMKTLGMCVFLIERGAAHNVEKRGHQHR
jgi:hypothetical protein